MPTGSTLGLDKRLLRCGRIRCGRAAITSEFIISNVLHAHFLLLRVSTRVGPAHTEVETAARSGVITLGDAYMQHSYENDVAECARVLVLPDADSIRSAFPKSLQPLTTSATPAPEASDAAPPSRRDALGTFTARTGYMNYDGGWAEAARAVKILIDVVVSRGAKVEGGKEVVTLLTEDARADGSRRTHGVQCSDGSTYFADRVIVATGSWTASNFPGLELDRMCLATG